LEREVRHDGGGQFLCHHELDVIGRRPDEGLGSEHAAFLRGRTIAVERTVAVIALGRDLKVIVFVSCCDPPPARP
jgi:hypothetical protein